MTDRKTPSKPSAGGRPPRKDAVRRAIEAASVDPSLIDPRAILAGIAIDKKAPATARVAAARALAVIGTGIPINPPAEEPEAEPVVAIPDDPLTVRALALMNTRGRPN